MATEGRMSASVAPREVLARLRRGVAKPQVKLLIGVSDAYKLPGSDTLVERVGRSEDAHMDRPMTRYATTEDGVSIAYQVVGEGPIRSRVRARVRFARRGVLGTTASL